MAIIFLGSSENRDCIIFIFYLSDVSMANELYIRIQGVMGHKTIKPILRGSCKIRVGNRS